MFHLFFSSVPESVKILASRVLAELLLTVGKSMSLLMSCDEQLLAAGLMHIRWSPEQPGELERSLCREEETVTALVLLHVSYTLGFRVVETEDMLGVLHKVAVVCPDMAAHLEADAVQSFVFLYSLTWADLTEPDIFILEDLDHWLCGQLVRCPVQKWSTLDSLLFRWCLSSENKSSRLGVHLVEHWVMEVGVAYASDPSFDFDSDHRHGKIFAEAKQSFHFLSSLLSFWSKEQPDSCIARTAVDILLWWINLISSERATEKTVSLYQRVLSHACRHFEKAVCSSVETIDKAERFLLPIICAMLKSPLYFGDLWTFRLKTTLHVAKLFCRDTLESMVENCLQFLSAVCSVLQKQDSKALISPLMQIEGFARKLGSAFESSRESVSALAVTVINWLSQNGQSYQGNQSVLISVQQLMSRLAAAPARGSCSLGLVRLVRTALSAAENGGRVSCGGAVEFVKETQTCRLFDKIFSTTELRQIYVCLQQFLLEENPDVRLLSVLCVGSLLQVSEEVCQYVVQQPWNWTLVNSMLSSRASDRLTRAEVEFCHLLLMNGMELFRTKATADNYLTALLKSELSEEMFPKAEWFVEQLKNASVSADKELLSAAENHLLRFRDLLQ
ncbi:uncharacterized protein LOC101862975 [Aplysia californica]|uniref:Uncharacterized protein LOC101862975 n=1 Tax=Aplysia californica TaxID=6500 RepID=A0ABM0K4F8_APLCA|nr:uncharacterized protein LOC101862975 [Aplysia californica]